MEWCEGTSIYDANVYGLYLTHRAPFSTRVSVQPLITAHQQWTPTRSFSQTWTQAEADIQFRTSTSKTVNLHNMDANLGRHGCKPPPVWQRTSTSMAVNPHKYGCKSSRVWLQTSTSMSLQRLSVRVLQ